jgi:hypothetical protein
MLSISAYNPSTLKLSELFIVKTLVYFTESSIEKKMPFLYFILFLWMLTLDRSLGFQRWSCRWVQTSGVVRSTREKRVLVVELASADLLPRDLLKVRNNISLYMGFSKTFWLSRSSTGIQRKQVGTVLKLTLKRHVTTQTNKWLYWRKLTAELISIHSLDDLIKIERILLKTKVQITAPNDVAETHKKRINTKFIKCFCTYLN